MAAAELAGAAMFLLLEEDTSAHVFRDDESAANLSATGDPRESTRREERSANYWVGN